MGENGRPGDTGLPGRRGDMGLPGMNGTDGTPGRDGLKGMKGMMVGTLLPLHSHTCSCHCLCLDYHNYVEVLIHKMDCLHTHSLCEYVCPTAQVVTTVLFISCTGRGRKVSRESKEIVVKMEP